MEGKVILSIEEYQELVSKTNEVEYFKKLAERLTLENSMLKGNCAKLKRDVIYEKEYYYIKDIAETNDSYSREKLFNDLVERFEFDSIKEINKTIEELVEKYKKEKENEKENVSN